MKLTLRATYGILAAVDLALHEGRTPVQAKVIARRQGIPSRFLEQVLTALKKAGLVDSQRGAQGGYVLSKSPSEVSLAQIVEALEGPLAPAPRDVVPRHAGRSNGQGTSVLANVWERLRQAEVGVLSAVTLAELAERQQQLQQEQALMYHI